MTPQTKALIAAAAAINPKVEGSEVSFNELLERVEGFLKEGVPQPKDCHDLGAALDRVFNGFVALERYEDFEDGTKTDFHIGRFEYVRRTLRHLGGNSDTPRTPPPTHENWRSPSLRSSAAA